MQANAITLAMASAPAHVQKMVKGTRYEVRIREVSLEGQRIGKFTGELFDTWKSEQVAALAWYPTREEAEADGLKAYQTFGLRNGVRVK